MLKKKNNKKTLLCESYGVYFNFFSPKYMTVCCFCFTMLRHIVNHLSTFDFPQTGSLFSFFLINFSIFVFIYSKFSTICRLWIMVHCRKRLAISQPQPSLIKVSLSGKNLIIPSQGEFS